MSLTNNDSRDLINDGARNLIKDCTDCDSACVGAMFHWGYQGIILSGGDMLLTFPCDGSLERSIFKLA